MEQFLAFLLLQKAGDIIFIGKYNFKGFLVRIAERMNQKFFYNMSECNFCMVHAVGVILLIPFFTATTLLYGFDLVTLIYPIMGASAIEMVKELKR